MRNHPTCMAPIGENRYRCSRYGFVVETIVLPIRCACPDTASVDGQTMEFDRPEDETPAAPELVNAIWELASNNESTRCVFEIGRMLARCQYCERFTGRGCLTFDGRDDRPELLDVLTDRGRWCPRWGRR